MVLAKETDVSQDLTQSVLARPKTDQSVGNLHCLSFIRRPAVHVPPLNELQIEERIVNKS
jgi:hypothetical protein